MIWLTSMALAQSTTVHQEPVLADALADRKALRNYRMASAASLVAPVGFALSGFTLAYYGERSDNDLLTGSGIGMLSISMLGAVLAPRAMTRQAGRSREALVRQGLDVPKSTGATFPVVMSLAAVTTGSIAILSRRQRATLATTSVLFYTAACTPGALQAGTNAEARRSVGWWATPTGQGGFQMSIGGAF